MSQNFVYSNKGGGAGTGEVQVSSALNTQVDGSHYKDQKMQPLELAYRVNGSPCFTKLAKYASRRKVDRLGDLRKAIHCIQLEKELSLLTSNDYEKLRVSTEHFHYVLKQFTDDVLLYEALAEMYFGNYHQAEILVHQIIAKEYHEAKQT